jgi:hypothetical protein
MGTGSWGSSPFRSIFPFAASNGLKSVRCGNAGSFWKYRNARLSVPSFAATVFFALSRSSR